MVDNLPYLKAVALSDVYSLLEKEKGYKGSWKKSGGRSCYQMIVRKMDRLQNIMARPEPPAHLNPYLVSDLTSDFPVKDIPLLIKYIKDCEVAEDIFKKITYEESISGGKGLDGSVLAECRDLRRYLLLLESEIVARGILNQDPPDDENLHARYEE